MAYESKAIELIRNIQKELAVAQNELETLNDNFNRVELHLVRERLAVLEDRVSDLKNDRSESDRRKTQYLYLTIGFVFTLLGNVLVQLLIIYLRK